MCEELERELARQRRLKADALDENVRLRKYIAALEIGKMPAKMDPGDGLYRDYITHVDLSLAIAREIGLRADTSNGLLDDDPALIPFEEFKPKLLQAVKDLVDTAVKSRARVKQLENRVDACLKVLEA